MLSNIWKHKLSSWSQPTGFYISDSIAMASLITSPGEHVLWKGRPGRSRHFTVTAISTVVFFSLSQSLVLSGSLSSMQVVVYEILSVGLTALTMLLYRLNSGIHYYVTSKKIVWDRDFYRWSKTITLPLTSIMSIYATRIGNKGFLRFEFPKGHYAIVFRRFKDDPEKVKELVMQSMPRMC